MPVPPLPLPTPVPIPSGWYIPPVSGIIPGVYFFETLGSGNCIFLQSFMGNGYGKLFEGYNGMYIMGTASGLIFSEDMENFRTISSYASSVTQIDSTSLTVVFKNTTGLKVQTFSQKPPETYNGWKLETTISGTTISDSAGEPDQIISVNLPILIGNSKSNSFPRVQRNGVKVPPLGSFTKSDTGIPVNAQITDLEAV